MTIEPADMEPVYCACGTIIGVTPPGEPLAVNGVLIEICEGCAARDLIAEAEGLTRDD